MVPFRSRTVSVFRSARFMVVGLIRPLKRCAVENQMIPTRVAKVLFPTLPAAASDAHPQRWWNADFFRP